MIQYVAQDEPTGCLIACVAMVAGKTYAEIRAMIDPSYTDGIHENVSDGLLDVLGFAHVRRYRYQAQHKRYRDEWPCAPFAPVHICLVHATQGPHAIVLGADGAVLDPWDRSRTSLTHPHYTQVDWIAGFCRHDFRLG